MILFNRRIGSAATETPVTFQKDQEIYTTVILREIWL